jgi:hypothetical protein
LKDERVGVEREAGGGRRKTTGRRFVASPC